MPEPKPNEIDAWKPDAAWKVVQALRSGDLVFLPADRVLPGTRTQKHIFLGRPRSFPASPTWFHQQIPKTILAAALVEIHPGTFLLEVQQLHNPMDFVPWLETMTITWPQQSFDLSHPKDLEIGR
jgi:predicted LPLAT superfamily acyltransferase